MDTIGNSSISINNGWLIDRLKHNLLSMIQFCDSGYEVVFNKNIYIVVNDSDKFIVFKDNIIFVSTNATLCKEFSKTMQDEFKMSLMGELKLFLGIQINQCKGGVYVYQPKYTKENLKKFKMDGYKIMTTPIFQSNIRETQLIAVKRIFKYLKGITNQGLLYKKFLDYKFVGFYDADYAGNRIERKSINGGCQFIGENIISRASKIQAIIALPTT
ncbi:uncharacterized mitochondrial protein AtMg00810-like [Vicia villosa]|uniref:uncharacterized mitochondrial protein AtMg00810-like n=1 Tax=Vicia villosa TaxID=3911 RepID=UPI00273B2F9C|nr:uncharacterized mitochondrial protein AtMg00810-like [Vicia villosa]